MTLTTAMSHPVSSAVAPTSLVAGNAVLPQSALLSSSPVSHHALPSNLGAPSTPASAIATPRPKRGRRKKRPDLTDEERKALRALQNRAATRRSRERSRLRAAELKSQLQRSLQHNQVLQRERDTLLYCMKQVRVKNSVSRAPPKRPNPMSLSVILNKQDQPVPDRPTYITTPPSKISLNVAATHSSPLSVTSAAYTPTVNAAFRKTYHSQTP
ncbi:Basic-leucine zipper [Gracilaria domingensis]|nr:Basic-leucine zipper [Gracilaria domingensis]